ncbi:MAG: efflux RND transporter permease subunit [bacterium]
MSAGDVRHPADRPPGAQNAIGTGVVGGMLSATFIAIFYIPLFFVLIFKIFKGKQPPQTPDPPPDAAASS